MDISVETSSFRSRRSSVGSTYSAYSNYSNYSHYSTRSSRSGAGRLRRWTSTASLKHQDKQPRRLLALRIASLAVGCAACGMAYSLDSFTAYSGDLKATFKTTQSQVESVASAGYIGLLSSLPAGLMLNRIGPKWMSAIALFFSVVGTILAWTSLFAVEFYSKYFSLIAFYYWLIGTGGGIMYVTASSVGVGNFQEGSLGLVSGCLNAFRSGIPGTLVVLYIYVFSSDYYSLAFAERRLEIYWAILGVCFLIVNVLGIVVYGFYLEISYELGLDDNLEEREIIITVEPEDEDEEEMTTETTKLIANEQKESSYGAVKEDAAEPVTISVTQVEELTYLKILRMSEFHLLIWPSMILLGVRTSFGNNIRTFADSFELFDYAQIILTIQPVVSTVVKPPIGLCSDALLRYLPRSAFLILSATLFSVVVGISYFYFDNAYVQGTTILTVIVASSFVQTLGPPLLVTFVSRKYFPISWSVVTVGWSGFTSAVNALIGAIYDQHVVEGADTCYGVDCYKSSFIVVFCMCLVSLVFFCFLTWREVRRRAKMPMFT